MSSSDIASDVYTGAATVGKIQVGVGAVVMILVCLGLIIGGVYMITMKVPKYVGPLNGRVTTATCYPNADGQGTVRSYQCLVDVSFKSADGKDVTSTALVNTQVPIKADSDVMIYYEADNTGNILVNSQPGNPHQIGWWLIAGALVVALLTGLNLYLTFRYKAYAAAEGAIGVTRGLLGK